MDIQELYRAIFSSKKDDVNRVYIEYIKSINMRCDITSLGFEQLDLSEHDTHLTKDGRRVIRIRDKYFAPSVELQRELVRDVANQDSPVDQPVTTKQTCTSLIDGQLCGGSLSARSVCQSCDLGKQGVAQITTCDICGCQMAVMR